MDSDTQTAIPIPGARGDAEISEVTLDALYDQHARSMYRYALAVLGSADDAEDAVSEVFVRVARDMKRLRRIGNLKSYLLVATRHAAFGILRSKRRREVLHEAICAEFATHASVALEDTAVDPVAMCEAFAQLPVDQREVLVLKVFDELSLREIAETVGTSINTVSSRYRYGIEKLRRVMEEQDNG